MNYIFVFICILIISLCFVFYLIRDKYDYISINNFPELKNLVNYKNVFQKEFNDYNQTKNWTGISTNDDINDYQKLSKINLDIINKYLKENSGYLNIGSPFAKIFWLKINKYLIDGNVLYCPNTSRYLFDIDNILNAGIIVIEPGFNYNVNLNYYESIIRCYIPFFVPYGSTGIQYNSKEFNWFDIDNQNDIIIFNAGTEHSIWNLTNTNMAIILLDIINK